MLPIFSAQQIKQIEELTCNEKGISSYELMEIAAQTFCNWFIKTYQTATPTVYIFCGNGNNGGDGFAIARILALANFTIKVYSIQISKHTSKDNLINRNKLLEQTIPIIEILPAQFSLDNFESGSIVIDDVLGTGTNRIVDEKWKSVFDDINSQSNFTISIDQASGILTESISNGPSIKADLVFGFEFPKLSYFIPENAEAIKSWRTSSINLSKSVIKNTFTPYFFSEPNDIKLLINQRKKFAYKHNFGHLLLIAGNPNMCGAAILSAKAAMRSGCGLISVLTNNSCSKELFTSIPEAMVYDYKDLEKLDLSPFQAVAIGPGLKSVTSLMDIIVMLYNSKIPLVLDAEAINFLSENPKLLDNIPANSILTPHIGEFDRLVNFKFEDSISRLKACREFAVKHQIIVVLKGAYSTVINSEGICFFNCSGNQGMATAGSGDVLTGIIGSLIAQAYPPETAAKLGVYIHGLAGDLSLEFQSFESLIASDIIDNIGNAFKHLAPSELQ
ncbi:MAG: NAD(P)H-hydrate dehydratase [Saprospiraceae bacterium]